MINHEYFKLKRLSDDLVYEFDLKKKDGNMHGYKRRDQDLWITYKNDLGWVAYDEETKSVMGRPWDVKKEDQNNDYPPEGIWVSRKGEKSYVYDLKYEDVV